MWMSSASRDLESRTIFETILKKVEDFLKSKSVSDADKEMVAAALEGENPKVGKTIWRIRLSTIDLPINLACFVQEENNIAI